MGTSMFDIDNIQRYEMGNLLIGAKVGDIIATPSGRQMFYVHNIVGNSMTLSGLGINGEILESTFTKSCIWKATKILQGDEKHKFFEAVKKFNLKFDANKGVMQC